MRYVIVEDKLPYRFSKFHDTFEEAKREAERLCKKEQTPFILLEVVGRVFLEEPAPPIGWVWHRPSEQTNRIGG